MQISGNQPGFNFFSAYKLAAAPQREAASPGGTSANNFSAGIETLRVTEKSDGTHRDTLLLQSAHRTAGRMADLIEAMPEL